MTRLQTEIFNYFDYGNRYTNAATEGLNQLTDKMNRMGNGYSFKRLRARALFWHIAAPRISFSLKSKKVPVYKAVQSEQSYPTYEDLLSGSFTATHSFADYGIRRHEEEEEFFVTQTSLKEPKRNQLSVFSYLPPWFR